MVLQLLAGEACSRNNVVCVSIFKGVIYFDKNKFLLFGADEFSHSFHCRFFYLPSKGVGALTPALG